MASVYDMLVKQVLGLSWIRCCMEEGVSFINKQTGVVEKSEKVVFDAFESQSGLFDLPQAKVSYSGLEKNILEVVGSYLVFNNSTAICEMLIAPEFTKQIKEKIEGMRDGRKENAG